jgi:L-Ala-D/L-Glu epimerase
LSMPTDLEEFSNRVREVGRQFSVLKLKLGSGSLEQDELIVIRARNAAPRATIFADANGGWSVDDAAMIIPQLKRWNIAFVEQPVHHELGIAGWRELRAKLGSCLMPLYADESAQTMDDVPQLAGLADGINVKLSKCGGWHRAREMIFAARVHRMKVMLGCMIESSIGVTAAAHLAPLADWIDLDGHLYVANDDYEGLRYDEHGRLVMPDLPGIGVKKKDE